MQAMCIVHLSAPALADAIKGVQCCWLERLPRHDYLLLQGDLQIENTTDTSTGQWQVDVATQGPNWSLSPGSWARRWLFSGATCAQLNFSSSCNTLDVAAYLVDYAAFTDITLLNPPTTSGAFPQYSDVSSAPLGLVSQSVCSRSCTNKLIPLNASATYAIILSNSGGTTCDGKLGLVTHATGSPGEVLPSQNSGFGLSSTGCTLQTGLHSAGLQAGWSEKPFVQWCMHSQPPDAAFIGTDARQFAAHDTWTGSQASNDFRVLRKVCTPANRA